jgi:hypothetical protein
VLGALPATGSGWVGARARTGGRGTAESDERTIARIELEIDVAIFEDGLCVGADEYGLRESLTEQIQQQLDTAGEIVRMLDGGATPGRIFEMLRPLARHRLAPPAALPEAMNIRPVGALGRRGLHRTPLPSMFVRSAMDRLVNLDDTELVAWFEAAATSSPLRLRRPS